MIKGATINDVKTEIKELVSTNISLKNKNYWLEKKVKIVKKERNIMTIAFLCLIVIFLTYFIFK